MKQSELPGEMNSAHLHALSVLAELDGLEDPVSMQLRELALALATICEVEKIELGLTQFDPE